MAKKFSELRAAMSPAAQQKANKKAKAMLSEMPLHELRHGCTSSGMVLAANPTTSGVGADRRHPTARICTTLLAPVA